MHRHYPNDHPPVLPHIAYRVHRLLAKAKALRARRAARKRGCPQQLELPLFR